MGMVVGVGGGGGGGWGCGESEGRRPSGCGESEGRRPSGLGGCGGQLLPAKNHRKTLENVWKNLKNVENMKKRGKRVVKLRVRPNERYPKTRNLAGISASKTILNLILERPEI